jgi:hypothetical protein
VQPRFYLDNNIWERFTLPENAAQKDIFVRLAQNKIIKPLLSDTNFIELCGNFSNTSTIPIGKEIGILMMRVMYDGTKILKSAQTLIVEDSNLGSRKRHLLYRYLDSGKSVLYPSFKTVILAGLGFSDSLAKIQERYASHEKLRKIFCENSKRFLESIKSPYTQDELRRERKKLPAIPATFLARLEQAEWIQKVAKVGAHNLGARCKISTRLPLRRMGLLGVFARAWSYLLFCQLKNDMLPKDSDLDDMFHCLLAGVVGNIVSDEKPHKVPGMTRFAWQGNRKVKCYSFELFNKYLIELERRVALNQG